MSNQKVVYGIFERSVRFCWNDEEYEAEESGPTLLLDKIFARLEDAQQELENMLTRGYQRETPEKKAESENIDWENAYDDEYRESRRGKFIEILSIPLR